MTVTLLKQTLLGHGILTLLLFSANIFIIIIQRSSGSMPKTNCDMYCHVVGENLCIFWGRLGIQPNPCEADLPERLCDKHSYCGVNSCPRLLCIIILCVAVSV